MAMWDQCQRDFSAEDLIGESCYAAIDLASTRDLNAMALLFPDEDGQYRVVCYYWTPEQSQTERNNQDRRQVRHWAAKGLIKTTPGNVTDYDVIGSDVIEILDKYDVKMIAYDPWGPAQAFAQSLNARGVPLTSMKQFRQTYANFAVPSKEFHRLIASQRLFHNGDPVLRWQAENVAAKRDTNDNIKPDKEASADKVDGIVATIMALGLALSETYVEPLTYYENNEVEVC